MQRLMILLLVLFAAHSRADTVAEPRQAMQLKVRPVLCITDARTPSCQMSFLILWLNEQSGSYCLRDDLAESPLRCWTKVKSGELNDKRTVKSSFTYWMSGEDDDSLLAQVAVEVLRMDTGDRRRKRRSRHVWDIL